MSNPSESRIKNERTIKCKHVFRRDNGVWNQCKRKNDCKFAHCIEEIHCLRCNQDETCRYFEMGVCMYKHSRESYDEWMQRTNVLRPDIPTREEYERRTPIQADRGIVLRIIEFEEKFFKKKPK